MQRAFDLAAAATLAVVAATPSSSAAGTTALVVPTAPAAVPTTPAAARTTPAVALTAPPAARTAPAPLAVAARVVPPPLAAALAQVERDWAAANYATTGKAAQVAALDRLTARVDALAARFPGRAEPLVWAGVVRTTKAGVVGGIAGFGLVKAARTTLEAAEQIDLAAAGGLGLVQLGVLYYQVPGFPIAFGDRGKARRYLERALALDPGGLAVNLALGDYYFSGGNTAKAEAALRLALAAPPRAGQEVAERGRRGEVEELLAKIAAKRR